LTENYSRSNIREMQEEALLPEKTLSTRDHLNLSAYWFSLNFHWGAMLAVVLPIEVLARSPEASKGLALGLIAGAGSFIGMVAQPVAGAYSDRCQLGWGRRRPFVLGGALINVAGLLWMPRTTSLFALAAAFTLVMLGNNISGAAYQGYIPDHVPQQQRGKASGYMGLMSMLGTVSSFGVAAALVSPGHTYPFYTMLALVMLGGAALTIWKVPDSPAREHQTSSRMSWIQSLRNHDFLWLSITRALVMLSLYAMVTFVEYFLRDEIGLPNFVGATLVISSIALGGSLASALFAGALSDRIGRKGIVSVASLAMAVTFLFFVVAPVWNVILVMGVLFGLGYGAYTSVDWALALDVLPDKNRVARDLGVWGFASTVPQTLAPLIGGALLYLLAPSGWGYSGIFLLATLSSLAAAGLIWRIRSVK
jgi:MFS family permease